MQEELLFTKPCL